MLSRIKMSIANTHTSPANPAVIGLDVDLAGTSVAQALAQFIGFAWNTAVIGDGSSIQDATVAEYSELRFGPSSHVPWPAAELADLGSDNSLNFGASYGAVTFGQPGGIAPLGTSVLITETTQIGGRHNGRMYLPWASPAAFDSAGVVTALARGQVAAAYNAWILGNKVGTSWMESPAGDHIEALPSVVVGAGGTSHPVLGVRVSTTPATLSSRKR